MSATPPRAPAPTNIVPTARYELFPLSLRGGEGRHSASHSETRVSGALSITGGRAELALDLDTFISYVHCPGGEQFFGRQACAPRDAKPHNVLTKEVLRGSARTENGALVVSLRGEQDPRDRRIEPTSLSLTCRESFLGFACSIDTTNMFRFRVFGPRSLAFLTPGTKRFSIAPADVKDVGRVTGSLSLDGGVVALTLAVDGGKPTTLPGTASWHDHGLSFTAQTEPTRNLGANCTVDGDNLRCEVSGDRSILGKAEHISSQMLFVPERETVWPQATERETTPEHEAVWPKAPEVPSQTPMHARAPGLARQ